MRFTELNIIADQYGSSSISGSDFLTDVYNMTGTGSLHIVGILTGSNDRGNLIYDTASGMLNYVMKSSDYITLMTRTTQTLITKYGLEKKVQYKDTTTKLIDVAKTGPYPYAIEIERSGSLQARLKFSRFDGGMKPEVISNTVLEVPYTYHFVCQKTGSNLEIYINGELDNSGSDYSNIAFNELNSIGDTHNKNDLFIGQRGDGIQTFMGALDEIKILNTPISSDQIRTFANAEMSGSYNYIVGNVFYEYGLMTIISPSAPYANFINQKQITPQPSQSDYRLDGGRNYSVMDNGTFPVPSGVMADYNYPPAESGTYTISSSYPYWPNPYESYPTDNYVDGGYVSSSYPVSQSYDGNYIPE